MGHYRIYQLDPSNHIAAGFSVECGSDAARTLLERSDGVEVWKGDHRVAHLSPEARHLWGRLREGVESRASRQQSSPAEHHATCGRRHYPSTAPLTRRQPSQEEPDDRAGDYARDEQGQQPLK